MKSGRKWMGIPLAVALCCLSACAPNTNADGTPPATDGAVATQAESTATPQADPGTPTSAPSASAPVSTAEWPYYPVSVGEEIRLYRKDGTQLEVASTYTADVLLDAAQQLMGYVVSTPAADGGPDVKAFYGPDGVKRIEGNYEAIQAIGDRVFALPWSEAQDAVAEIVWPEGAAQPSGETGVPYVFGDLRIYIAQDEFRFYDASYQLLGAHKGDLLLNHVYPDDEPPRVFPFCEDGVHWGLIDSTATVVVQPDYLSLAMQFNTPSRFVYQTMDGQYGAMDATGKRLTEPIFADPIEYYGDVVQVDGPSGYSWVTPTGEEIAKADWGQTLDRAPILIRNTQDSGDFLYQVLDRTGKPLSGATFVQGGVEGDIAYVQTVADTEIWKADGTVSKYPGMIVFPTAPATIEWQGQTLAAYSFRDEANGRIGYCTPDGNRVIDVEGQYIAEAKLAGQTVYIVQKTGGLYGGLRSDGTPLFDGDALELAVSNDIFIVYTQEGVRLCSQDAEVLSTVPYVPRPEDGDGGGEGG